MMSERDIDVLLFGEKTCTACGNPFPANTEHFGVDAKHADGLTSSCKTCRGAAARACYGRSPAKYIERNRQYRKRKAASS